MIHSIESFLKIAVVVLAVGGCVYYILCLWASLEFLRLRRLVHKIARAAQHLPPVSILKPLKGVDPHIYESFRSHCLQDYPEYEIIFGVSDPNDPAIASVRELQREFPDRAIKLVICSTVLGTNVKVSNLAQMASHARFQYLVVNDSDIRVEPDYLLRVITPLADQQVGMVTCLYRGVAANTLCSRLEALGISTDFSAGVLAAHALERGINFGLGSTLAFRREDLQAIGGFEAVLDHLADDYELGNRIAASGRVVQLSEVVVETHLPAYNWRGYFQHQLRWGRSVRDARPGGYFGLMMTFGLLWTLLTVLSFHHGLWPWTVLALTLTLRVAVAYVVGNSVLLDPQVPKQIWLLPLRDLLAVVVWIASFAGHSVNWRGDRFELKKGKLIRIDS